MSPLEPEALEVAFRVLDVFRQLDVAYHLGGSYASSIHGMPRQTHDVDLVAELDAQRIPALVQALEAEFYVDEQAALRAVANRSSFNLVHLASGVKVDVFVKGESAFDDSEFERRIELQLDESSRRRIFVKSAEDTILRKLHWYRLGGEVSERQWSDARWIVSLQRDRLDLGYLRAWANRLEILDLLERLLD